MSVEMAKPGITTNASLSWIELPPGMGGAQPIFGSPHAYVGTVILKPGEGFDFHHHPNQNEVIFVFEGEMEGWVDREQKIVKTGDVMVAPAGTVHACFNSSEKVLKLLVVLDPLIPGVAEDDELIEGYGWELVPDTDKTPWSDIRAA